MKLSCLIGHRNVALERLYVTYIGQGLAGLFYQGNKVFSRQSVKFILSKG